MPRRKLNRFTEMEDNQGVKSQVRVNTYKVNKSNYDGHYKDKVKKNTVRARHQKAYLETLNQLKVLIKNTKSNVDLVNLMLDLQFNDIDVLTIMSVVDQNKITKHDLKKVIMDNKQTIKYTLTKLKNANILRDFTAPKKLGASNFVKCFETKTLNGAGSRHLLKPGRSTPIWVVPECRGSVPLNSFSFWSKDSSRFEKAFLTILKLWAEIITDQDTKPKQQSSYTNPDYHMTQTIYVGLDSEWFMIAERNGTLDQYKDDDGNIIWERLPRNVLSFQLSAWSPDTKQGAKMTIHNSTSEHFQFSELLRGILVICQRVAYSNEDGSIPGKFNVKLLTYMGGVDISTFAGYDMQLKNLMVINKNYIFSPQPLPFDVTGIGVKASKESKDAPSSNEFKLSLDFIDVGLLAPQGGLSALGDAVGMPKMNTEIWDLEDGHKLGYYKAHMNELRGAHPDDYLKYAQLDADITLEYYLMCLQTFPDWIGKTPATIGSYSAKLVYQLMSHSDDYAKESIFDRAMGATDITNSKGVQAVKYGQADLFKMALKAYFGGFNTAFMSNFTHGVVVDIDAVSCYNVCGLLLSVVNLDKNNYSFYVDHDLSKYWLNEPIELDDRNSFNVIYNLMKANPFVLGVVECEIHIPDDVKMTTTPFESSNKDYGPCYVRNGVTTIPLIDAFNAYRMGGSVKIIHGKVPAQSYDRLSAYGTIQSKFLSKRNVAKHKRDVAKENGNDKDFRKYDFEQLLSKLLANALYGKTGQGCSSAKRARDFNTGDMEDISYSPITNPLIACSYTGFTRYIVTLLYEACTKVHPESLPLNITTDGYTCVLPSGSTFKEDKVREAFLEMMPDYYFKRCHINYSDVLGFEVKGLVDDDVFNIKTRVNGTVHYDDTNGGIKASASIRDYKNKDIYDMLVNNDNYLINKELRLSNLNDMKFHLKNRLGHQESWQINKVVNLQYDFAYCPNDYVEKGSRTRYFNTLPFPTVAEHDRYKKVGGLLVKYFHITTNKDMFNAFKQTMNESNLSLRKDYFTTNNFDAYCFKNWCAVHDGVDIKRDTLYTVGQRFGQSRDAIKKFLQRHKRDNHNVNYLASCYFEQTIL